MVHLGWSTDADGQVLPELQVQAIDTKGLSYFLEARVRFGSTDVEWTTAIEAADPLELLLLGAEVSEKALFSEAQTLYTSDYLVQVVVVDSISGVEVRRLTAPPLRLVWPDGGEVLVLDRSMAAALAPQGVYDEATRASLYHPSDDDVVVEYGYHE